MNDPTQEVSQFLYREARFLDTRDWMAWLELFTEDAVFRVPAWKSEHDITTDPTRELSLIYCASRMRMSERVQRVLSGRSVASIPLPRTQHAVSNVMMTQTDASATVQANFTVHLFDLKKKDTHVFFGHSTYQLLRVADDWRIRDKTAVLANDYLPTLLDFYCV